MVSDALQIHAVFPTHIGLIRRTPMKNSPLRPVLVYIHGGSLVSGWDTSFGDLQGADIVFVGIKYRVK